MQCVMIFKERKANFGRALPSSRMLELHYSEIIRKVRQKQAKELAEQDTTQMGVSLKEDGMVLMLDGNAELLGVGRTVQNSPEIEALSMVCEAAGGKGEQRQICWSKGKPKAEEDLEWWS